MKNKISEIFIYNFHIAAKDSTLSGHEFYDQNGNHTESLYYYNNGDIGSKRLYEYDSLGQMIKERISYRAVDSISTIHLIGYDENGKAIDYKKLKLDGTLLHQEKQQIIQFADKSENVKLLVKNKNNDSFFLSKIFYFTNDRKNYKTESFDSKGNKTEVLEREFDDRGNLISEYNIKKKKRILTFTNKYNDNNMLIERNYRMKAGKKINGKTLSKDLVIIVQYQYDMENNLVERKTLYNNVLTYQKKFFYKKIAE